jgi:hypothetical protein
MEVDAVGVRTWLGLAESAPSTEVAARAHAAESEAEFLRESLADLELALEDTGWERMSAAATAEFSRAGLGRAAQLARIMSVANPLVKRGLAVRQAYVWGQGVQITARSTGDGTTGQQDVNAVVQGFLDDDGNQTSLTGDQAHEELERALGTDGNVFIALFTSPLTGFVQARTLPFDEISDVITNPDDRDDPWYYPRTWTATEVSNDGQLHTVMRKAYYPALGYRPATRQKAINGVQVMWDTPVKHIDVNGLSGWTFGIGDAYAALSWARLYRDFLGDWAVLVKSLSQFAWRATSKGSKAQRLRAAMARRPAGTAPAGNENSTGATAVLGEGTSLEAIPKSGATIDSESGRPLAAMVAAALGVPVTVLLADPGQTGARAVAETLNLPMRLEMMGRRSLWSAALRSILGYVIAQAVKAPQGPLQGTITRDRVTGRESVVLAGDTDPTVEIVWPSLDETPMQTIIEAIVKADSTGKLPPLEVAKLLLQALGVRDIDEIVADLTDENGRWLDPLITAGQVAIDAYRRGADPAGVV